MNAYRQRCLGHGRVMRRKRPRVPNRDKDIMFAIRKRSLRAARPQPCQRVKTLAAWSRGCHRWCASKMNFISLFVSLGPKKTFLSRTATHKCLDGVKRHILRPTLVQNSVLWFSLHNKQEILHFYEHIIVKIYIFMSIELSKSTILWVNKSFRPIFILYLVVLDQSLVVGLLAVWLV